MKSKFTTKTLVRAALLTALSIVFTRYLTITIPVNKKIGLGQLPLMIAGILYGPRVGGISGFVCDMVGFFMNPDGLFFPGYTLSAFLEGFLPGLVAFVFFKRDLKNKLNPIVIISSILVFMGIRLLLDSVRLAQFSASKSYGFFVVTRIPKELIETAINAILLKLIIPRIEKYA